ncbi:hypothetical protein V6N13_001979 [Hibiscus sabdariffa]
MKLVPPVEDPPAQDPPIGAPPVGDPPVHMVEDPDEIDEMMASCVVWRLLQRAGGSLLEYAQRPIMR